MEYSFTFLCVFGLFCLQGILVQGRSPEFERKSCPSRKFSQPPNRVDTSDQLAKLRIEMRKVTVVQGPALDAYIIPYTDEHQSLYAAERDRRLKFISGITGNGMAIVTKDKSAIWIPDLYYLQANEELSCDWLLFREHHPLEQKFEDWLKEELPRGARIGADPTLISNTIWEEINSLLSNRSLSLVAVKNNLIDLIWTKRPARSLRKAYVLNHMYTGKSWQKKVDDVRKTIKSEGANALVLTALDEIAWLLNVRGKDIPFVPVIRSYLILTRDEIYWYVNSSKIDDNVSSKLGTKSCHTDSCVRVRPYEEIWSDLKTFSQIWKKVWLPSDALLANGVSRAIYQTINEEKRKSKVSPIVDMKSVKNPTERAGMRRAHVRDGAAFCNFMAYFEAKMAEGETWTELTVAENLDRMRREQDHNQGISFATIVGFGPHGALPHNEPTNETALPIDKSSLLLIDSGGHYLDGTTDVTRTFHFGTPTEDEIDAYTRVLIGHMNLAMLTFPSFMKMSKVDILARGPVWETGADYPHGTGHGIGAFLSVHEGPILISQQSEDNEPFKEGYFFSDEPGMYKEGLYGVRLENILEVVEKPFKNDSTDKFFQFLPVTLVPFEPKLIDLSKLSSQQIRWLNEYNTRIRDEVGAELKKQVLMKGFYWMLGKTKYIPEDSRGDGRRLQATSFIILLSSLWIPKIFL